jgi:hypothetical protein
MTHHKHKHETIGPANSIADINYYFDGDKVIADFDHEPSQEAAVFKRLEKQGLVYRKGYVAYLTPLGKKFAELLLTGRVALNKPAMKQEN